ncbi:MAG TPA: bifunctional riboflavin kinase/FAD synthetase [Thiolinea sp.]|nr:bifunctional riboflavin kinase/FAD synthetase [Thiolinea sp.]
MKLLRHPPVLPPDFTGCVATIGNFDGVHVAHRQIITRVCRLAAEQGLVSAVISFEPLPGEYFRTPMTRIQPLRDKVRLLQTLAPDWFVCLPFNRMLAQMEAGDFVQTILLHGLQVRQLVVGDDFRFGRQRQGDLALLRAMGARQGMQVMDTPTLLQDAERVSSTRLREALGSGQLSAARELLGHPYQLSGRVRHGDRRGRTIGFPTLNLSMPDNLALAHGVYAVRVHGLDDRVYGGVGNLGLRPTVKGLGNRFEVHLFDFSALIYGRHVRIEPLAFLRPEHRFPSFEALKQQIAQDAAQARDLLGI